MSRLSRQKLLVACACIVLFVAALFWYASNPAKTVETTSNPSHYTGLPSRANLAVERAQDDVESNQTHGAPPVQQAGGVALRGDMAAGAVTPATRDHRPHLFPSTSRQLTTDEREGLLEGGRLWAAERAFATRRAYIDCTDDTRRPELEEAFLRANHISYHADSLLEELGPTSEESP